MDPPIETYRVFSSLCSLWYESASIALSVINKRLSFPLKLLNQSPFSPPLANPENRFPFISYPLHLHDQNAEISHLPAHQNVFFL